jgi:hypothetical protein
MKALRVFLLTLALPSGAATTGIWYSTWYTAKEPYIWLRGFGVGSTNQFVSDITGDGKADAVAYWNGDWYGANSNGVNFQFSGTWITGHGIGSSSQMLSDVTGLVSGVSRADAVVFFGATGEWYVAASNGTGFSYLGKWASGCGTNSTQQFLANIDGDFNGRSDAVSYYSTSGLWTVSYSSGTSFSGFGYCFPQNRPSGVSATFVADVTGDGRADAVQYVDATGLWWVAPSNGTCFGDFAQWSSTRAGPPNKPHSTFQLLGEVNSPRADAVEFFGEGGTAGEWWVSYGLPSGFQLPSEPSPEDSRSGELSDKV